MERTPVSGGASDSASLPGARGTVAAPEVVPLGLVRRERAAPGTLPRFVPGVVSSGRTFRRLLGWWGWLGLWCGVVVVAGTLVRSLGATEATAGLERSGA